jgi:hypothetical protein
MKHLHEVIFSKDSILSKMYTAVYIEYNSQTHPDFSHFEEDIKTQLKFSNPEIRKKILLIDDYDRVLEEFEDKFSDLIESYYKTDDYYLILAGQKNCELLDQKYCEKFGRFTENVCLSGLDQVTGQADRYSKEISTYLIDGLLSQIGFPIAYLSGEVKQRIAEISSAIPSLVKRILKELLSAWLKSEAMHPVEVKHVEKAASRIIDSIRVYSIDRAVNIDEMSRDFIPDTEVRISEILNAISVNSDIHGVVDRELLLKKLVHAYNEGIKTKRVDSFHKKIECLFNMGFVIKKEHAVVGIPNLFFYKGDILFDEKRIRKNTGTV